MFKNIYKNAYHNIKPDGDYMDKINKAIEKKKNRNIFYYVLRPVIPVFSAIFLFGIMVIPVLAREIPAVYCIIEEYSPALLDYIIPEEQSSTCNGIKMQVEAINVKDNTAEVIVSFSDEEGYDYINGKLDLYDSYRLYSYKTESNIGGCRFLEYNELEDKAYFKVDLTADESFDTNRITFKASKLLTHCSSEKKDIDLSNMISDPATKTVELNGIGGGEEQDTIWEYIFSHKRNIQVLDLTENEESLLNELTITGIAYTDGILRLQTCRGNFSNADRHLQPFLMKGDGTEIHESYSLDWQETIKGEKVLFTEFWFVIDEAELGDSHMYGIFHIIDDCIKGDWKVTFQIK